MRAKARYSFIKQAAIELSVRETVIKNDLGKVLLKLEALQEENIRKTLEPQTETVTLADDERNQALALLHAPDLLQRILDDFNTAGVAGEETNKLVGYLATVSRKLDKPLAIIIQSTSAGGRVLSLVPPRDGHAHVGERRRHPLYPSDPGPRRPLDHREIYTHVAIDKLKAVHQATHPAQLTRPADKAEHHE